MKKQNKLILAERVQDLVEDIEKMKMAVQHKIEALEQEREACLARIEPSPEVVAAKARIESLLGLVGNQLEGGELRPVIHQEGAHKILESSDLAEDKHDWLTEENKTPVEKGEIGSLEETPDSDDDWLSGFTAEEKPGTSASDDFW